MTIGSSVGTAAKPVPALLCAAAVAAAPADRARTRAARALGAGGFALFAVMALWVEVDPDATTPLIVLLGSGVSLLGLAFDRLAGSRRLVDGSAALAWALLTGVLIVPSAEAGTALLTLLLIILIAAALWRAYAVDAPRGGLGLGMVAVNFTLYSADLLLVPVPRPFVVAFFLAGVPLTAWSLVRRLRLLAEPASAGPATPRRDDEVGAGMA